MVEKLRFLGKDQDVVVDFGDEHSCDEASRFAFDQHLPIVSFESDDGFSVPEILGRIGEHRQSCLGCQTDELEVKGEY